MKSLRVKLPRVLEVIDEEKAKEHIDSDKYLVLLIPIEEIEIE